MKKPLIYISLLFIFLSGSCSDTYTKNWAKKSLAKNQSIVIADKYLELRYTENYSVGFNLFSSIDPKIRKSFILAVQSAVIIFLLIYIYKLHKYSFISLLPFVIILSGAASNLTDRFQHGYVTDFIYFHIKDKFSWSVFNVADILICIGAGLLFLEIFCNYKLIKRKQILF